MIVAMYSGDPDEMDRTLAASKLDVFMISEVPFSKGLVHGVGRRVRAATAPAPGPPLPSPGQRLKTRCGLIPSPTGR